MNLCKKTTFIGRGTILSLVLIILLSLVGTATPLVSNEGSTLNAVLDRRREIQAKWAAFEREEAYGLAIDLQKDLQFEDIPYVYLENLSEIMAYEKHYQMFDKLIPNAVEIIRRTENRLFVVYRIAGYDALAYHDYFNFDNVKMADKLNIMLAIQANSDNPFDLWQYYYGLGQLAYDESNFPLSRQHFLKAKEIIHKTSRPSPIGLNLDVDIALHVSNSYISEGQFSTAIAVVEEELLTVEQLDLESQVALYQQIATIAHWSKDFNMAKEAIAKVESIYYKTSKTYRGVNHPGAIASLKASIAYSEGDFIEAARLYHVLFNTKSDVDTVEKNIAAMSAASTFEMEEMNAQLSLLEQFKNEQSARLSIQSRWLTTSFIALFIMSILIIVIFMLWRAQRKQRNQFYLLSITDQLTQVYNRRMIMEVFAALEAGSHCVALLDLDHFKGINDTYGHQVGDEVLKVVASTIKQAIGHEDAVGRYGGEEFLVILKTNNIDVATEIMEDVRLQVQNLVWDYPGLKTTLSAGLVFSMTHTGDLLLTEVDSMLYRSKDSGRNRITAQIL